MDTDDCFDESDTSFNYDLNSASFLTFGDVQHDRVNVATRRSRGPNKDPI